MKREHGKVKSKAVSVAALLLAAGFTTPATAQKAIDLSDRQIENIVRRSYQYVAMYNVNNKLALDGDSPGSTGGWNKVKVNTTLADHELRAIARPNNDTLYNIAAVDVSCEAVILEVPAYESKYASMQVTPYDHYVQIPMSSRRGDFERPSRVIFFSQRTKGYRGEPVRGIDTVVELTADFAHVNVRVMPHANEPDRMKRILAVMPDFRLLTMAEYRRRASGEEAAGRLGASQIEFPEFGATDFDVFENNLLEVMQFVFNHTTFDPKDDNDQGVLAAFKPLGVEPGKEYDASTVARIDGVRFRQTAQAVARGALEGMNDPRFIDTMLPSIFLPKGEMTLDALVFQSVVGPAGQPAQQALYPPITTADGKPMNAMHDYVIRMDAKSLPPANAFWSLTLYDTENGFFIPNDSKKYSVGENAGMKLDADGGIAIHIAAEKPEGVPEENWLPVNRGDYGIDLIMRIYAPDLKRFKTWTAPKAERIK